MVEDAVLWLTVFCAVWGLYRAVGAFKTKVSVTLTDGRVLVGVLMAVDRHNAIALPHVATCCHTCPRFREMPANVIKCAGLSRQTG